MMLHRLSTIGWTFRSSSTMVFHNLLTVSGIRCIHNDVVQSPNYAAAVETLNSLQSNAQVLELRRQNRCFHPEENVLQTEKFLNKIGIELNQLDKLNIIHIGGTKGKGSTSSFCESLLRIRGYKTGFFSSPHLVAVRERIRLNGQPISEEKFTSYFWHVYKTLQAKKEEDADMPAYFKFLTVMAYYVFLQEKVDVAVIEVGIGGQYDCTNVIRNPVVCGIASLGIDHVMTLGGTIDKIAWQKAGIMKPNVPVYTVTQPMEAMQVLIRRAQEIKCPLHVVPSLDMSIAESQLKSLDFSSGVQYTNAALALQMVKTWLAKHKFGKTISNEIEMKETVALNELDFEGLRKCVWPGRCQKFHQGSVIYFLDGAHTVESIEVCVDWFKTASKEEERKTNGSVFRILVFNMFGDRKAESLLPPFFKCHFDMIAFCPNFAHMSVNVSSDQNAVASNWESQMERCTHNSHVWMRMAEERQMNGDASFSSSSSSSSSSIKTVVFPSICDVLKWMAQSRDIKSATDVVIPMLKSEEMLSAAQVHVLVTGSLHLVGGFLSILDPHLSRSELKRAREGVNEAKPKAISWESVGRLYSRTPGTP